MTNIYRCAFCDKPEYKPKWFVIPGYVIKPNEYSVCEAHQNLSLTYDDVYPNDQSHPITRHEYKVCNKDN